MLICFRVFQGVGGAMIFSTGVAILTSVFPPQERGKVLGFNVAAVYSGLSLGPVLGGVLTHYFTWRSIFLVNVLFGIVIIWLLLLKMKVEWAEARGEKFDFIGAAIYGVAILGVIYGLSLLPSLISFLYLIIGSLALFGFVKRELKVKEPVFDLHFFVTNRVFAFSNLTALINYSGLFALTFLLSLYLQHIKGLDAQGAGLILVFQPIMMALCSPFAGRLSDKIEPRIVASAGMALSTLGLFLLVFLTPNSSMGFIIGAQIVLGLGFALFSSPNTNAIMGSVERKFYGLADGSRLRLSTTIPLCKRSKRPLWFFPCFASVEFSLPSFGGKCAGHIRSMEFCSYPLRMGERSLDFIEFLRVSSPFLAPKLGSRRGIFWPLISRKKVC